MYTRPADQPFDLFDGIVFPARQRSACLLLEVFDDADLLGEFGLRDISLPLADRGGLDPLEVVYVEIIEIVCQVLLGQVTVFSALFEVFVEVQDLP